jgi:aminopeptidase YwaD
MGKHRVVRIDSVPQAGQRRLARGAARIAACLTLAAASAAAQIVPPALVRTVLEEVSGAGALRETAAIANFSRYPNSQGFFDAAEHVAARARALGLENVRIERFPSPGAKWDAVEASLEIVAPGPRVLSTLVQEPLLLAQRSKQGDVTAALADADGDVKGKVALTSESPAVWPRLARRGALGVLCAWRPEYFGRRPASDAVAWGEAPAGAFAFMISPRQGDELREAMKRGPVTVRLRARVQRSEPGEIGQVMGEIPGEVSGEDIVVAAHLDHQKQGANDNASGSGALLEVLRAARRLIADGKAPKPRRTIRFWWSTEIQSERAYFKLHPEEARRISLAVVLDQAGGDRRAENNFIMIANPRRAPSWTDDFIHDLAEFFARQYAPAEHAPGALAVESGGGSQSMRTVYWDYAELSDNIAFVQESVGIQAITLAVPSLDVIHTGQDTVDRLDPTWLRRCAAMTLIPALFAASAGPREARRVLDATYRRAAARIVAAEDPKAQLDLELRRLQSAASLDKAVDVSRYRARLAALEAQTR